MGLLREIGVTNEIKKIFKKLDLKIRGTFTKLKTCPTEIVFLEKIREHLRVRVWFKALTIMRKTITLILLTIKTLAKEILIFHSKNSIIKIEIQTNWVSLLFMMNTNL